MPNRSPGISLLPSLAGTPAAFLYDPLGRRVSRMGRAGVYFKLLDGAVIKKVVLIK